MDTRELVSGFEDGTLPAADFHHREHVRIAFFYLDRYGRDEALRRLAEGLLAFAARAGRAAKFDRALTCAWVAAIDDARRAHPAAATFDELIAARPDLLDRSSVRPAALAR